MKALDVAVLYENPAAGFGGGATIRKSALNPLARSSLDQQIDILRLAMMGEPRSRDLWIGFERECPAEARMAAKCVDIIKSENAAAEKQVGKVLAKAQGTGPKRVSRKKMQKRLASGRYERVASGGEPLPWYQPPTPVTKRAMWTDTQLVRSAFWHELHDPDPHVRAIAERAIAEIDAGELAC